MRLRKKSIILRLLLSFCLSGCASVEPPGFEPISHDSGTNTIRLSLLGRYSLGLFDIGAAKPAAYDPPSQLLFVVSKDVGWVDFVDISDPAAPKRIRREIVLGYGGFPESIDVSHGMLAVALSNPINPLTGRVLFLDTDGNRIGDVVTVGVQPVQLRFTPSGREIVVANQGEADDDFKVDPLGSISIIDLGIEDPSCRGAACDIDPKAVQLGFENLNDQKDALIAQGVRIYGPGASVAQDLEPEALAIAPKGDTAWVSLQRNNAMAVVDIPGKEIIDIFALGSKDHSLAGNGLDGSDVDGKINIRPWPIRSFYSPDIFAAYEVGGRTLLVTPNEGDPRDDDAISEDVQVRELSLDPVAFPDAANLQDDRNIGRLRVTDVDGDTDGDGDFDQIFALGSRSFSIWTGEGDLVYDSGDDFEQILAEVLPECFNCGGGSIRFDEQSDDRGPEPETLAVGQIGARHYAFIAPERIGGLYVYDITDSVSPVFQQYINFRDFAVNPAEVCEEAKPLSESCAKAGDLEPEGVLFIPATDSPIGAPLVVVSHELSTSTTLYRVDQVQ